MTQERAKRKLTAIFSADVNGYSRLMADDDEATVRTINAYREMMTGLIKEHRGRVVDAKGDNVLAEFPSVVDAVRCAVEVQKGLKERNSELQEHRRMEFRIGINLGDVIEEEGTIYGDGVNVAARLEGLAQGGGVCISGTAFDHVKGRISVGYEYQGQQTVKNIPDPVRVYKLLPEPEAAGRVIGEAEPRPTRKRRAAWAAVLVLAVVAIGLIWNFYFWPPPIEPASVEKMAFPLPEKPSIAVLPFDNLSGDPKQTYLVDGLTENIIGGLSKIPEMFVIGRNSTFTYKDKPVKVQQVAEKLGVRYVLEGSIQISGEQLRVTAQLVDALKGHHVWSEKYDRNMENFFSVQDDITLNIAIALQVKLTEGEQAKVRHSTRNLEAWALAVKAHGLFETYTRENIAKARELFEKAVELDPEYTYAWSYLGWTYWIDGVYYSAHYDREKSFESAAKMAEKALSVDHKSSDAYALLSSLFLSQKKYDEAEAFGKKTIDLDPNSSENHAIVAITMQNIGKFEEAIALVKQAMRLDPYYPTWYLARLGMCYRMLGMYEESVAAFEERIKRSRERGNAAPWDRVYLHLAATYSMMGRMEEARELVSKATEFNPKMTVDLWRKRLQYKDPKHTDRILDALRKAGLPETPPLPLPDRPSIAVLPFENMSGDPEQEYFSDGLSEEIITALSKTPKLFVIARNSTFTYKGKPVKVQQVGRELGVKYVLEGSVRKVENRVRITAQLVDAQTGHHLWAERYDRDLKDIFAIQDEITKKIITAMQVTLTEGGWVAIHSRGTDNLEAYLLYLQAVGQQMHFTRESVIRSRQLAEEAVALDPEFASAYRILALSYWMEVPLGMSKDPRQSMSKAMELVRKSLALDESSGSAHTILGFLYTMMRQHDKGISECERGVVLEPNSAWGQWYLGTALRYAGRHEEAINVYRDAMRLNPIPPSIFHQGLMNAYCLTGRYEDAILEGKKAVHLEPDNQIARAFLAAAYSLWGREEEARLEAKEVLRINPRFSVDYWAKTIPYKNPGDRKLMISGLRKAGLK